MPRGGPRRNSGDKPGPKPKSSVQRAAEQSAREAAARAVQEGKVTDQKAFPAHLKKPPEHLKGQKYAEECWNTYSIMLHEYGILSDFDVAGLSFVCEVYHDYMEARLGFLRTKKLDGVSKCGTYICYPPGHPMVGTPIKINPAFNAVDKFRSKWLSTLAEFGLTPASRGRITLRPGYDPNEDEKDEFDA